MRFKIWTDKEIWQSVPKRGGIYRNALIQLMLERDYAYRRNIRESVNEDIDKLMRRLN